MKGEHRILIYSKRIKFEITVRRNITIFKGDSATGKTTLISMIRDYNNDGADSGITLVCDKNCEVLNGRKWSTDLDTIKDSIVFIDEGNKFVSSEEFARKIQGSDNYYVIISRENFPMLPYSINEIYGLRESGKYSDIKQIYNESYSLYKENTTDSIIKPTLIITEDSKTGYQFFSSLGINCIPAGGKSNIIKEIIDRDESMVLVIADGAALGAEIDTITKAVEINRNYVLYTPESFEWLLLKSGIFSNNTVVTGDEINKILENPSDYIESSEYFSWERFFTGYIVKITTDMQNRGEMLGYKYPRDKKNLPSAYLRKQTVNRILNTIHRIKFI